ncbi:cytochrome P450 4C1-like [Sitophilus oryzae]|uniref:Cytochrome P450 4C1-like n=1 Tax=Sitophilus oryzae TaxID=7048 RepID=A0A6J2XUC1_SITOR|nr:cytochrome P450 4C1-like [Sitophilus oryzae]QTM97452.1 Cytochrome P450 [Sitophilus oryzae]
MISAYVVPCAIACLLVWMLASLFGKRRLFLFARDYKGPRFYPVVGNGLHAIEKDFFNGIQDHIKDGLPSNLWLCHEYYYITDNATEIREVLNNPNSLDKMKLYGFINLAMKDSLLLMPVDLWKKHRKFCSRSFSQPVLNSFVRFFYNNSVTLNEVLKDAHNKDTFEIFERYTFETFCESVVGYEYKAQLNHNLKLVESLEELQTLGSHLVVAFRYIPIVFWLFLSRGRRALKIIRNVHTTIYNIIEEKRKSYFKESVCYDNDALPLVDSMLYNGFNNKQIFDEVFLFILAATDTSGGTLAYFFTLLGMHQDIQNKVYEEVMEVVGPHRPIYQEDLNNLKYTERCIFEAMRIFPVVPYLGRYATADIPVGTKVIPKDTNIFISIFNVHRNENYYPDPLKYDPDRFLPEEIAKRDSYAFIPFSGGPRNCIGKTYALMLLKTAAASVIRNYQTFSDYKSVTELNFTSCISMKTVHKLDCRFKPRIHPE